MRLGAKKLKKGINNSNAILLCENKRCPIRNTCRRGDFSKRETFQKYIWRKPNENGHCDMFLKKVNN